MSQILAMCALVLASFNDIECPRVHVGWASYYDETPARETLRVRQEWGHIPEDLSGYDGFIATLDCSMVGHEIYARASNAMDYERLLVFDCAGDEQAVNWMRENNILGELDPWTAQRWEKHRTARGLRLEIVGLSDANL